MKNKLQMAKNVNEPKPQIEVKLIKHTFTTEESNDLGMQLARAHTTLSEIDAEFELLKSNFKSRTAEQEAIIGRASSARLAGYEMRNARCRVVFRPKAGKKDYFLEHAESNAAPVLTEEMTGADMQAHLIPDEPKFENREALKLWHENGNDSLMEVGRLTPELCGSKTAMWFAALNVMVGGCVLLESLDNNQPCATKRIDIIRRAAKRCKAWLMDELGKETAEGFYAGIDAAVEAQKEREE